MVDWKASSIQIIASLIGSSLVITGLTSFYSEFYNKPDIHIKVTPMSKDVRIIEVTNTGRIPATNLLLTVVPPLKNISKYDYHVFSTENYTVQDYKMQTLNVHVPRFVHQSGSQITIDLIGKTHNNAPPPKASDLPANQSYDNTVVYATYDQGSVVGMSPRPLPLSLNEQLRQFYGGWYVGYLELISLSVIAFIFPFLYKRIKQKRIRQNKRARAKFLYDILREITEVHSILRNNIISKNIFQDTWNSIPYDTRQQFIDNIKDYIYIDDFYEALRMRNTAILNNQIDHDALTEVNKNCLSTTENILNNIEWKRYDVSQFINIIDISHILYNLETTTLFSFLGSLFVGLPGLGHIYIGRLTRGIAILVVGQILFILLLSSLSAVILLSYISLSLWQIFDARKLAKQFNERFGTTGREPW